MEYTSHLGVYALVMGNGRVLVIRKARGPYTGLFDLPGGSQEPGELLEETLIREVLEETGCRVTEHRQLRAFSVRYPHQTGGKAVTLRHVGVIYRTVIEGTPSVEPDGLDSNGCVWMAVGELDEGNSTPFVRMAVKAAEMAG